MSRSPSREQPKRAAVDEIWRPDGTLAGLRGIVDHLIEAPSEWANICYFRGQPGAGYSMPTPAIMTQEWRRFLEAAVKSLAAVKGKGAFRGKRVLIVTSLNDFPDIDLGHPSVAEKLFDDMIVDHRRLTRCNLLGTGAETASLCALVSEEHQKSPFQVSEIVTISMNFLKPRKNSKE